MGVGGNHETSKQTPRSHGSNLQIMLLFSSALQAQVSSLNERSSGELRPQQTMV